MIRHQQKRLLYREKRPFISRSKNSHDDQWYSLIPRYLGLFGYKPKPHNDLSNLHNILPCFRMYNYQVLVNKMDILQYRNLHTCYWIYCNPNAYSCSKKSCITMHYDRCLYVIRIDQWFQIFVLGGRWLRV